MEQTGFGIRKVGACHEMTAACLTEARWAAMFFAGGLAKAYGRSEEPSIQYFLQGLAP
jgi:hypothetical protein